MIVQQRKSTTSNVLYSPYKAGMVVNEWLLRDGINKVLPGPMLYNYTTQRIREGKKPFVNVTKVGDKVKINEDDLLEWYKKYTKKNFNR